MKNTANALAEQVYQSVKQSIFDFEYIPGDRFTEQEIAERHGTSRTPVRDALYRLEREGYLQVAFRSGWNVRPFDFKRFGELYDVRVILEQAAIKQLCENGDPNEILPLRDIWCVPAEARLTDGPVLHELDETFHRTLVATARNAELSKMHMEVSEKIRIVRRLDFTSQNRMDITYDEHSNILNLIARRKTAQAVMAIRAHIEGSKAAVQMITLHMLHEARARIAASNSQRPAARKRSGPSKKKTPALTPA